MLSPTVREITRHGHPRGQQHSSAPAANRQEWFNRMRADREQRELVTASLAAGVPASIRKNGMGAL
jgi:hypothetical protein